MGVLETLLADGPVLTDGALGSLFWPYAADGISPMEMNLARPEDVFIASATYRLEGSRILLTNTFQASRPALARLGLPNIVREVNEAAVMIARDAAGDGAFVFGSIGPTGGPEAFDAVSEQAGILAENGVDGFVIETMTNLDEAAAAVRACKKFGLPVVACMAFIGGVSPEDAARSLEDAGADVIGANCTTCEEMLPLCRRLKQATGLPVWMKPNAGLPRIIGDRPVWELTPDDFAAGAMALVDEGADFIGGCCGTRFVHIRALAAKLLERKAGLSWELG